MDSEQVGIWVDYKTFQRWGRVEKFQKCDHCLFLWWNRQPGGLFSANATNTPASNSATTPVKKKRYDGLVGTTSCCSSVRDYSLLISELKHPPRPPGGVQKLLCPSSLFPPPLPRGPVPTSYSCPQTSVLSLPPTISLSNMPAFSPQFYWEITDIQHCVCLRCTVWWFDLHILWSPQ